MEWVCAFGLPSKLMEDYVIQEKKKYMHYWSLHASLSNIKYAFKWLYTRMTVNGINPSDHWMQSLIQLRNTIKQCFPSILFKEEECVKSSGMMSLHHILGQSNKYKWWMLVVKTTFERSAKSWVVTKGWAIGRRLSHYILRLLSFEVQCP